MTINRWLYTTPCLPCGVRETFKHIWRACREWMFLELSCETLPLLQGCSSQVPPLIWETFSLRVSKCYEGNDDTHKHLQEGAHNPPPCTRTVCDETLYYVRTIWMSICVVAANLVIVLVHMLCSSALFGSLKICSFMMLLMIVTLRLQ